MSIRTRRLLRGMARSWTVHSGIWLAVLGFLQTQNDLLTRWFGDDAVGGLMMLFGALTVALRAKTTLPLEERGRERGREREL